jgi:hypothetical protein
MILATPGVSGTEGFTVRFRVVVLDVDFERDVAADALEDFVTSAP